MYSGTLSYFAQLQAQYELSALSSKAKTGLLTGKGIFGYEPKVDYYFGLRRSIIGLSLLAAKKSACLITMTLALLLIKRILLKSGIAMFSSLYSSLAFSVSAFAICQCDEGC